MAHEFMNDERTTAYLLNELSESETEQFEDECFAQPEWPDAELDSAEEDLIQAYIKKELSPERRQRFEEYYLTTDARRERVLLAGAFLRVACSTVPRRFTVTQRLLAWLKSLASEPPVPLPRFAGIVLTIGLGAALLWFVVRPGAPQTFANISLAITSESRRATGSPVKKVELPLAEDALRISMTLPEPAPQGTTYRVQWEDITGPLEDLDIEKQDANSISVVIPAAKLKEGQYTLKLFRTKPSETEELVPGDYLFYAD
jgi:hypothetical protein